MSLNNRTWMFVDFLFPFKSTFERQKCSNTNKDILSMKSVTFWQYHIIYFATYWLHHKRNINVKDYYVDNFNVVILL